MQPPMADVTRACARLPHAPSLPTNKITWALTGLLVLAVLLPVGVRQSEAAFVAQTANPGSVFSSAASFNTVSVALTDPGTPLRGTVTLNAVATSDRGISERRLRDLAGRRQHMDHRVHRQPRALQLQLGHDRHRRRPA